MCAREGVVALETLQNVKIYTILEQQLYYKGYPFSGLVPVGVYIFLRILCQSVKAGFFCASKGRDFFGAILAEVSNFWVSSPTAIKSTARIGTGFSVLL